MDRYLAILLFSLALSSFLPSHQPGPKVVPWKVLCLDQEWPPRRCYFSINWRISTKFTIYFWDFWRASAYGGECPPSLQMGAFYPLGSLYVFLSQSFFDPFNQLFIHQLIHLLTPSLTLNYSINQSKTPVKKSNQKKSIKNQSKKQSKELSNYRTL